MNIASYCRVSTDKADQLNSLEAQKEFFSEYTKRTGDTLVRFVKDISRFARNTVALLQNVHKLKSLEIEPQFFMKYILEKSSMASKKFESDIQ